MRFIIPIVICFGMLFSCTNSQKESSEQDTATIETEISQMDSSTTEMERVKDEIDESSATLDSLLNEL